MPTPITLLFGDSHVYAVQRAIDRRTAKGLAVPLNVHRLLKTKNDVVMGDTSFEEFLKLAGGLGTTDTVISMIGGNQHAVFSTIQHPHPFSFLLPGDTPDPAAHDVAIIPYRALAGHFDAGIRGRDGKSLQALRDATSARVIHLQPPPPKRDNQHILRHHESNFANEHITQLGVSPPELRLKFWRLQSELLARLCSELDIDVLPPPAAALDPEGYLAPYYWANDATHANPSYGELVLQQLEQAVAGGTSSEALS